jgi:predicted NACHT family NTPase
MPEGETWARDVKLAGRLPSEEEAQAMGRRLSEPQPLLDLLAANDCLILLGDPGSGKTTFLKYLTLVLATGQGEALELGARLPVLVPLSAYATALAEADMPLDRFIDQYYRDRGVELPIDAMLRQALQSGGALLLLDGLDEVRATEQRSLVVDRVVDFYTTHRRQGNKFVLTSRIVGYTEVRPQVEGIVEGTIVDLQDGDIATFIDKWTGALERNGRNCWTRCGAIRGFVPWRPILCY